ncbi:substrate-binding and vWA domain-containing protein [Streptomyces doebereineriae]|uniref:Substrate-binding and VWA domain-containing protein n=1 Tax=Streptomyces doebereineriae TaxID=3075528 RepID=A0ABU2VKM7_9ACTN|nr:substrate-binding and VWA domain-containing protein [Streptomyces sp. DSM 41640]MDT0486157.1 substrate-binding and VWA domain-containing protein [Streptomyces sp. DSM 41640]
MRRHALAACLAALGLLAACTAQKDGISGLSTPGVPGPAEPGTLRVLASSELSDMAPVLARVEKDTGIKVRPTYIGTLDAVDMLAKGRTDGRYDAVWLSSNDYLRLRPEAAAKVVSETPVMSSPVAIGVKPATVKALGWQPEDVTWSQVEQAVQDGKLTYGMTDPARSNSGFATLVSVASALSGAQSALTDADVGKATPRLKEFFTGQKLTSGSSGWLAATYERRGDVDALLNYESVLKGVPGLTVIRPRDGVITADYPLTTLKSTSTRTREDVRRLTEDLRTERIQREISARTHRRPVIASVPPASGLDTTRRRELPFPGTRSVADGLLDSYENELRRPSRTVYVLDTSGSMEGDRLDRLKTALTDLTGDFREREEVTLMPFGSEVKSVRTHVVEPADPRTGLDAIREDTSALSADGDTAIYTSLEKAYGHLGADRDTFTSIVLMTDGENTAGVDAGDFDDFYRDSLTPAGRRIPVFPILFGDSDRSELAHIADLTGGRLIDARQGSLDGAFEEIRGYQ